MAKRNTATCNISDNIPLIDHLYAAHDPNFVQRKPPPELNPDFHFRKYFRRKKNIQRLWLLWHSSAGHYHCGGYGPPCRTNISLFWAAGLGGSCTARTACCTDIREGRMRLVLFCPSESYQRSLQLPRLQPVLSAIPVIEQKRSYAQLRHRPQMPTSVRPVNAVGSDLSTTTVVVLCVAPFFCHPMSISYQNPRPLKPERRRAPSVLQIVIFREAWKFQLRYSYLSSRVNNRTVTIVTSNASWRVHVLTLLRRQPGILCAALSKW